MAIPITINKAPTSMESFIALLGNAKEYKLEVKWIGTDTRFY